MKIKAASIISNDLIEMRTIELRDIEILRIWKNEHKEFFFYKNEISSEQQLNWFKNFCDKHDDHMFIIEKQDNKVGCIGVRLYQDFADVYNVILGDKSYKGKHIMTRAMEAIVAFCNLIYRDIPVRVRVLRNNPAIKWYEKIGFEILDNFEDHVLMQYNNSVFVQKYLFKLEIELPKI